MSELSNKAAITLLLLLKCIVTNSTEISEEYGTCDQTYNFFKNTMASSNSERECDNGYNIFPYIEDEGANKFQDGLCAYQCKLQLHPTCFAIHAPQTTQKDSGLLKVEILEQKMTEKWKHVLHDTYQYNYDSFLDFNMAFWVSSLDDYIAHWDKFKGYKYDTEQLNKLEYIGIQWNIPINDENIKFYSLLIHSPFSAINYEFMSQHKPSQYNNIKWLNSAIPRCTFKSMNKPYPWNRNDEANIVPVRLSHAVTNIAAIYDFYINVMGATLLYDSYHKQTDIDSEKVESFAVALIKTEIELQFIQRPAHYTFGDFSLKLYEKLLLETHSSIITSPYCGIDRWFDNHYGYATYGIPGYMDTMIMNLNKRNMVYRVYKLPYEHSSGLMKKELDLYGFPTQYGAILIDPTGQCIEVNGWISDPTIQRMAPVANPQWCVTECQGQMIQGTVDPEHIYKSDNYPSQIIISSDNNGYQHHHHISFAVLMCIIVGAVILFLVCSTSIGYLCCKHRQTTHNKEKKSALYILDHEKTPLI